MHVLSARGIILCNYGRPGVESVILEKLTPQNVTKVECVQCMRIAQALFANLLADADTIYELFDPISGHAMRGHEIRDPLGITSLKSLNASCAGSLRWRLKK